MSKKLSFLPLIVTVLLCLTGIAFGQEITGNIRGTVKDPNGAVVQNATVTATNPQRSFTTTSDSSGNYEFQQLPVGRYVVKASASGFSEVKREDIPVELGKTLQVNLDLAVGGATATVNVTTNQEPLVDVTSTKTATNVTQQQFDVMPKGLNFSSAINVAPGTRSEAKAGGFQIDGASGSENNFIVDGLDVTRIFGGQLGSSKNIPFDFVKEVQIKSAGYEAEFGGATGGVVNVVTRSGGNEFHGEGRLEYTSDHLRAKDSLLLRRQLTDLTKAQYFRQPLGKSQSQLLNPVMSVGGPILKNRLWFFTSWSPEFSYVNRRLDLISVVGGAPSETILNSRIIRNDTKNDYFITRIDATPWKKIQVNATYINSPVKTAGPPNIIGGATLQTTSTTTFGSTIYTNQGGFTPSWQASTAVTYTPTANLVISFRGGRTYLNDKGANYAIPTNTFNPVIRNACGPPIVNCAAGTTSAGNPVISTNSITLFDITKRTNLNWDASFVTRGHVLKGGYQRSKLENSIKNENSGGYGDFYFNQSYNGQRGTYGYYAVNTFGLEGTASSTNQAIFIQDSWRVHRHVTLNLGVRFENEFLPAYPINLANHPSLSAASLATRGKKLVSFGWTKKIAPRLGGAWDVWGDGKLKIYGSFSMFYDTMKYDMARGSGGGEFWIQNVYTLEQPDFRGIDLATHPGTLIQGPIDLRLPSVGPSDPPGIDPNLKPMREREYTGGADYAWRPNILFSARLTRKQLDYAIDDIGHVIPGVGEEYTIGNPGYGIGDTFYHSIKAIRNYTGLELRMDKRFSNNWYANLSYVYSRLYGNYGGLASSDENGRANPNVNRYFDNLALSYDNFGKPANGLLNTDRPNTFKAFGDYRVNWGHGNQTDFGGSQFFYQGVPVTTSVDIIIPGGAGMGVYPNGRGDLGRTKMLSQTDVIVNHRIRLGEHTALKFSINVLNLFNQQTETSRYTGTQDGRTNGFLIPGQHVTYATPEDYVNGNGNIFSLVTSQMLIKDPRFNLSEAFQTPREARISIGFEF